MRPVIVAAMVLSLGLSACAAREQVAIGAQSDRLKPVTPVPGSAGRPHSAPNECEAVSGGEEGLLAQLVDVQVVALDGYDRITFEFAPSQDDPEHFGMPSFDVHSLTPPIIADPSGQPVSVEGDHYAGVVLRGASAMESSTEDPGYAITYTGPTEFKPGFQILREAQQTGDFERVLSWAFGLSGDSCWTVTQLEDPLRLVIDFPAA
jgi:hypothetical protein